MNQEIRWLSLKNNGGFNVSIRIKGGSESYNGSSFPLGQERTVDLADAVGKINDGDTVYLEAVVKGGKNRTASERFTYRKTSNKKARYSIKGGTLTAKLSYNGVEQCYTKISEPIRWISLKNNGGFNVSIRINGGSKSFETGSFPLGQERILDLADAVGKINDGDEVWLEAVVKGGNNNTAKQHFVYRKSSNKKASYTIKGTTVDNTMPYNGISDYYTKMSEPIRGISLKNNGGFVANMRIRKESESYNVGQDICVGQEQTIDLAEAIGKIKDGDEVWLEAVVKAGTNNTAKQRFIYRKSSNNRACYAINGTTLNNTMSYKGTEGYYIKMSDPIRCISLKNVGGFVARITVKGGSRSYNVSQDICVAQEKRIDLADAVGIIKDGDEVWLEAVVKGGKNQTARQRFVYRRSSDNKACYTISGSTQINTLSYNGTFKVGVLPTTPATNIGIISKINDWERKKTGCAWPGIEKSEVVNGLRAITNYYFGNTNKYTKYRDLNSQSTTNFYSGIDQGLGFQTCGPTAVMFYLAKLNISTFVDVITTLYETGSLMGYNVPYNLRKIESDTNEIEKKYECYPEDVANVCWMFEASLAQKESVLDMNIEFSGWEKFEKVLRMHTRPEEMVNDINYVFNATNVKHQYMATWSTVNKALDNLNVWIEYLKKTGSVMWLMHANVLKKLRGDTGDFSYNHVELNDLHWVVVSNVQKTATSVTIDLHSWGRLYRITVSHEEFRKMTYGAVLFNVK